MSVLTASVARRLAVAFGAVIVDQQGKDWAVRVVENNPADMESALFTKANLDQAKLSGAQAVHTDFTDATMRGTKLVRATPANASYQRALGRAYLNSGDLEKAVATYKKAKGIS